VQYNYGLCDKPVCEYCDLVRAATAGAVEPPTAATQADLNAGLADMETKVQTGILQLEGRVADGDYALAKNLGTRIDAAVSGLIHGVSVDGVAKDKKPTDTDGAVYIVDPAPTGTFAGHANQIASMSGGVWSFQAPSMNETHLNETDDAMWTWNGTIWVKVGSVSTSEKVNDAIHKAPAKATPGENDEFAIADSEDISNAFSLKKLSFANLKARIWGEGGRYLTAASPTLANPSMGDTDSFVTIGGTTKNVLFTTWAQVKADVLEWIKAANQNLPVEDTDSLLTQAANGRLYRTLVSDLREKFTVRTFLDALTKTAPHENTLLGTTALDVTLYSTTNDNVYRFPVTELLKYAPAPAGLPTIDWRNAQDWPSQPSNGTFDIAAAVNPRHLEFDGYISTSGADSAFPVLVLVQGTSTDIATALNFPSYGTLTYYTGNQVLADSSHPGNNIRMVQTGSVTTHMKGADNAYFTVKLYREVNQVEVTWQILYKSSNSTIIKVDGFASGSIPPGPITGFGVTYIDSSSGADRDINATTKLTVHH
jgi:hypothetical protein